VHASRWIAAGAAWTALAVGLGAFGAHSLRAVLEERHALDTWNTAVHYHGLHGLGMIVYGLWRAWTTDRGGSSAGLSLAAGSALFSGSLYFLALGGPHWLGPVTPLGGILMLVGWLMFAWEAWRAGAPGEAR
jgi:uncharacterized membrane protein YgdD (TMEM256/DUF423 family)